MTRVLLVEPDLSEFVFLGNLIASLARIEACATFPEARSRLLRGTYDRLISNLRLEGYHGLHLVYFAPPETRSIVYTERCEVLLAQDVQRAGAFYEWRSRLEYALPGYLGHSLPAVDRRDASCPDRRVVFRQGRRCADVPEAFSPSLPRPLSHILSS